MEDARTWQQILAAAGAEMQQFNGFTVATQFGDQPAEHAALTEGVAMIDASRRTQVALAGDDSADFLHNMCTNEIRKLPVGSGCEAFLTSAQGRILAHVQVFREANRLILETVPGQAAAILAHLDRYIIREKVELTDLADSRAELILGGPRAKELLTSLNADCAAHEYLAHQSVELGGLPVSVRCVNLVGAGSYLLDCSTQQVAALWQALQAAGATLCGATPCGATPCGEWAADAARILAGFPAYGRDITDKNLPQEVGRDHRTISFVKGCYIGQETVARIDAMGHVNRLLVRLRLDGIDVPQVGSELSVDGKSVGQITSAAFSPGLQAAIALAYVRNGNEGEGSQLSSAVGNATVMPPPVPASDSA